MFTNRKMFFSTRGMRWQFGTPGTSGAPATPPPAPPATPPATPPTQPEPNADPVRQFKQSELDHLFAERARQAQGKAVTDLLKDLGLEKTDDLKAIIAKAREQENASKTEAQKLADEIAALKKSVGTANTEKQLRQTLSALLCSSWTPRYRRWAVPPPPSWW